MNRRSRLFRTLAALLALTWTGSACVTWVPVTEPLGNVVSDAEQMRITTVDGVTVHVRQTAEEPIRVESGMLHGSVGSGTVSLPLTDIAHVEMTDGIDQRKTMWFAGAMAAAGGALLWLMASIVADDTP